MNGTLDQLQRAVGRLRTFTSDASHELRGPLTTLKARLELALARPDRAEWTTVGDEALHDTTRLEEIVADLLLLARLDARQPLKLQPLCVTDLVRRTVAERYPHQPRSSSRTQPQTRRSRAAARHSPAFSRTSWTTRCATPTAA